jgi:crotonobetainyl-CoA:carnitine CoA-transferase CaiB-like acyl-CoA transferase
VALNLKHPRGKEIFLQLVRDTDGVENFPPHDERLALGAATLRALNHA